MQLPQHRLRVLALHGYGQTATSFMTSLTPLAEMLGWSVTCIDVASHNQNWWTHSITSEAGMNELHASAMFVAKYLSQAKPRINVLLGFSSGAVLVDYLIRQVETRQIVLASSQRPNIVITLCGFPAPRRGDNHHDDIVVAPCTTTLLAFADSEPLLNFTLEPSVTTYGHFPACHVCTYPSLEHRVPQTNIEMHPFAQAFSMIDRTILVFDFDGVICDSAHETGLTAWAASKGLVTGADGRFSPPPGLMDQFCAVRPILETGYEAIIMLFRLVNLKQSVQDMLRSAETAHPREAMEAARLAMPGSPSIDELKKRLQQTRDGWIANDEMGWIRANPLYAGVADMLRGFSRRQHSQQVTMYICSTKHTKFVQQLLHAAGGIDIPLERIYGLGSGTKWSVLARIAQAESQVRRLVFVEDRLEALLDANNGPAPCELILAGYGYNTVRERERAGKEMGFTVVSSPLELQLKLEGIVGDMAAVASL